MEINILNNKYDVLNTKTKEIKEEDIKNYFTEYFLDFDYVIGDYYGDRLRLKGFYDKDNKKVKKYNNFENKDSYLKENIEEGANYFILRKQKSN